MKGPALIIGALSLLLHHTHGGNSDPSQAAAICAEPGSNSILVAHEDCHKFYKCYQGIPVAISCPQNLVYNPDKEYCDWPSNVQCNRAKRSIRVANNLVRVVKGHSDPSQAKEICAAAGSDDTLIAHEECNKFYECSEGHPIALKCPDGLLYNPDREYCDWPGNVDCGGRTRLDSKNIEEAEATCSEEGSEGKLIAHDDCDKFYECSGGVPIQFECPDGLLFDPGHMVCNWAENVQCQPKEIQKKK